MNNPSSNLSEKEEASLGAPPSGPSTEDDPPLATATPVLEVPEAEVVAVQVDAIETIDVIAPSDLHGGYPLTVQDGEGRSLRVQVPDGGVTAGQSFPAMIMSRSPHDNDAEDPTATTTAAGGSSRRQYPRDHVPIGNWRDGIWDCCRLGLFHPLLCLAFWAPPVALAQVMTRLHLNTCAEYQNNHTASGCCTAFRIMLALFLVTTVTTGGVGQVIESFFVDDHDDYEEQDGTDNTPEYAAAISLFRVGWAFFYYVFIVIVAIRTRAYVRGRYKIRPRYGCGECEDVCCVMACYPCVVCQLSRHTVDYENHRARCCTDTGLASSEDWPSSPV